MSHPFGADGGKAGGFEVLDLSADGKVTRPAAPVMFTMGTALDAPIVFTPDGVIGLVAQDDGSVGEFKLAGGPPQVVDAAFKAGFYASRVVLSADGAYAYVLDQDTANNGGGVYEIAIGCDGALTSNGLIFPGNNAWAMALLPTDPTKAVLAAVSTLDSPAGKDTHIVDLAAHTRVASAAGFPDTNSIASSVAVTPDGKYALVADDNSIAGGNRLAVVSLAGAMGSAGVLSTPNPAFLVASPFGNAALVMNDDSTDQIHVLAYDAADAGAPFTITGELAYKFPKPQIPITAGVITQGALKGLVLVGEVSAVRTVTFTAAGGAVDTAQLTFDQNDLSLGVGVIGVQP